MIGTAPGMGGPFVFLSHSHSDAQFVDAELDQLRQQGFEVWYDETGIGAGRSWPQEVANALRDCAVVLFYASDSSLASDHCFREVSFALEGGTPVVIVHLHELQLPDRWRLSVGDRQAIFKHRLDGNVYRERLAAALNHFLGAGESPVVGSAPGASGLRWSGIMASAVLIAVFAAGYVAFKPEAVGEGVEEKTTSPRGRLENSIAVLPFENLSPDPDNAYFAAGIHEEILNQLAKIREMAVISRTSVLAYGGSAKRIETIGEELNVETIMEGSVRYAGDRVRIAAQLIDAGTGVHIWSETYDRNLEDIFAIQSDIAVRIADALKVELSVAVKTEIGTRITGNLDAYTEYVQALSEFTKLQSLAPVHEHLDAAIAIDPNFADALAMKSMIHGFQSKVWFGEEITLETQERNIELARTYARRALAADSTRALAYVALYTVALHDRNWDEANRNVDRAYELNPASFVVSSMKATALMRQGHVDEGAVLWQRAIELDPTNWSISWYFGRDLTLFGRWQQAEHQARRVIALEPTLAMGHVLLARIALQTGRADLALASARRAEVHAVGLDEHRELMMTFSELSLIEDARRQLERREALGPLTSWERAAVHEMRGEIDAAIDNLELGVEMNFPSFLAEALLFHRDAWWWDAYRGHPRFEALVQSLR